MRCARQAFTVAQCILVGGLALTPNLDALFPACCLLLPPRNQDARQLMHPTSGQVLGSLPCGLRAGTHVDSAHSGVGDTALHSIGRLPNRVSIAHHRALGVRRVQDIGIDHRPRQRGSDGHWWAMSYHRGDYRSGQCGSYFNPSYLSNEGCNGRSRQCGRNRQGRIRATGTIGQSEDQISRAPWLRCP